MLNLLNPLGLVALAALLVPAAIHLRRFPQRTVRLGSLKFLEAVARPRLNPWRWRERLRLLLRLALIALLALLLAKPEWRRPPGPPVRWALLGQGTTLAGAAKTEWDALMAKGYNSRPMVTEDIWSVLREADARVAAGSRFVVFAPRRLAALRGQRAALAHATVEWIEVPGGGTERWADAVSGSADGRDLKVSVGISDATSTRFEQVAVPVGTQRVTVDGAQIELPTEIADVKPLRVVIYRAEDRSDDARAVNAAVRAVAAVSGRVIAVAMNSAGASPAEADWAFVLGKTGPAAAELRAAIERGLNVVSDVGEAAGVERAASFRVDGGERIALWRRGPVTAGTVLARDSFGEPVLTRETIGRGGHFHFSSRFNSEWSDWTQSTAFPAWVRGLLLAEDGGVLDRTHDRRGVSEDQTEIRLGRMRVVIPEAVDLARACWWLVAGIFVAERLLSHFWTPRRNAEGAV
ncbi:MAG: BatA domain-containing protein [Undibacterium sp.]|nr:BatA domain-containing protein [Opitutaceae bacterium]